jgi:hypothetical protein
MPMLLNPSIGCGCKLALGALENGMLLGFGESMKRFEAEPDLMMAKLMQGITLLCLALSEWITPHRHPSLPGLAAAASSR